MKKIENLVINPILIDEGLILLIKDNGYWIFPGGKLKRETHEECLHRTVFEQLGELISIGKSKVPNVYSSFSNIKQDNKHLAYLVDFNMNAALTPESGAEDIVFLNYKETLHYKLSNVSRRIVERLHRDKKF